jgi:hypothetical protein
MVSGHHRFHPDRRGVLQDGECEKQSGDYRGIVKFCMQDYTGAVADYSMSIEFDQGNASA